MSPTAFSGALGPKKKAELHEIAVSLQISDEGTKEELQARIKKHLEKNPQLEEEELYAGLFPRRKRSVQPQLPHTSRNTLPDSEPENDRRGANTAKPPRHSSLQESLIVSTDNPPPAENADLPPQPDSPLKRLLDVSKRDVDEIVDMVKRQEETVMRSARAYTISLRDFLSNSQNIWTLTALLELSYILLTIIPWTSLKLRLSTASPDAYYIFIPYPPFSVFQTTTFWIILLHWALPTLLLPAFVGIMISFQPATPSSKMPFDALTASIVRLAAQVAYPYSTLGVKGADVLGSRIRYLSAGVGLALAFAEAIAKAPASYRDRDKT